MTRKPTQVAVFGAELRRLRAVAGLTMSHLAEVTGFSKGYISKVETGQKSPSPYFVRAVDAALSAGGLLITLTEEPTRNDVVVPRHDNDASTPAVPIEIGFTRAPGAPIDRADAEYSLRAFETILDKLRDLGQTLDPSTVVGMLEPHVSALRDLMTRLDGPLADEALLLAAHFADFTSWMTQEAGDDDTALRWIDVAATFAEEANDGDMVANSYIRRANVALYQQDAYGTITFARRAQAVECSDRVMGLALQREAQGHALAGDQQGFSDCLDRAVALHPSSGMEHHAGPTIGPMRITDPFALAKGWSLFELGRSVEAIDILEPLLARTPKNRSRAWARIASRLALALASVREVDRACEMTKDILALPLIVRSATIRSDLRQLSRMLNRWSFDPTVQDIMPHLSAVLLPTTSRHPPSISPDGRR